MSGVRDLAIRWYRKAFGAPAGADIREEGFDTVLDGNTAVALAEAAIASHAVLGGASPASAADTVWRRELDRGGTNLFGETLSADAAEGPRGIVAAATGLSLAGRRATAFLTGTDAAAAQDLLASAAGKHVPLVLHLVTQAVTAHGSTPGSGHDTVHLCADSGWFILFARNVQQAVDFTFIARRVAEEALIPGLVVMDGAETALAVQDVRLPSPSQVEGFLGATRDEIGSPTPAQRLLFGERRRTLPAWHDLDEPMLSGALFGPEAFALGASARRPFFDDFIATALAHAIDDFGARTGRQHRVITRHKLDKAELTLVAQGAAIETANLTADLLRKQHGLRVGVVGIQVLRPFPRNSIADALAGTSQVIVMERADAPLSADRPLTREVRGCLALLESPPACRSAVYGVGGFPLRRRDVAALCTEINSRTSDPLYLGIAFDDDAVHPKREVLLDTLRRAYPDAATLGVRAPADAEPPPPKGSVTIAIRHRGEGAVLAGAVGALLFRLLGGRIRSRLTAEWPGVSRPRTDVLIHGGDSLQDPGDGILPDLTLDIAERTVTLHRDDSRLSIAVDDEALLTESLLGGLFGALTRASLIDAAARRISGARREMLVAPDEAHRDAAMAAFEAGFNELTEAAPAASALPTRRPDDLAPAAVRELARNDDHVASLPRFWDQAGVLYRDGETGHLTADPYLATGTMPPLSATFTDIARSRASLPAFDGALCTGCGLCWTRCPDSAIGVAAATPASLIDSGIRQTGAEAVRQVASKLAGKIVATYKKDSEPPSRFGPMLENAFDWLQEKAPLPEERRQAIREGIDSIVAAVGSLPVAVTQPFFADAEARQKDSAELLSIAVNPDACKACGLCIASCEPGALTRREQDADVLSDARALWETWCTTPDTPGTSIEAAAGHPDVGPTASMLLSRYCQFAMAGGDPAEPGSGEKLAARLFLAAAEYQRQPVAQRFAAALNEAGDTLRSLIHDTLSGALPDADLDAIAEQLESTSSPRVNLGALAEGVTGDAGDQSIDTRYLKRLIRLSKQVDAARHQLVHGTHGLGRARYGLTIAGGTAAWAGSFPSNPFQAPAVIEMNGAAPQLAAGLIEGHLDETTELVRLLRLARLEADKPDGLDWKRQALRALRWQDLEDDELELCPPMILVGSDDMLAARGLSQLIWLLNSRLPVKVLILSSLDLGLVGAATTDTRAGVGLLSLAQRNAYVAQTSLADPGHFGACAAEALDHDGPALVQVYAPSPSRDGYAADELIAHAQLAVAGRVLPLFRYDPRGEGVFGSRIRLDGNPQPASPLAADEDRAITLGDWALGQRRFAGHFKPMADDAPAPVPLHEWLLLDAKDRKGKTPFVAQGDGEDQSRFVPSTAMRRATDETLRVWRTLQELAGVVTPFTRRLEAEIRAAVAEEHQAELDAQKQAAAAELEEVRQKTQAEIAGHLRRRLLELATRRRD